MSKLETNTIDNISGSSTLTIGDSNASTISIPKNITLGASGTTITVPSGATITNNGTQTGFGGTNTPAFEAFLSSNQNVSDSTLTKIQCNSEIYDTDNNYDNSSNYRFTPTTAGKYWVYVNLSANVPSLSVMNQIEANIYKNGASIIRNKIDLRNNGGADTSAYAYGTVDMNGSSDYLEFYGVLDLTSGQPTIYGNTTPMWTKFGADKIIE
jgi:hypothetical protein